jgi:hypothetical protein
MPKWATAVRLACDVFEREIVSRGVISLNGGQIVKANAKPIWMAWALPNLLA